VEKIRHAARISQYSRSATYIIAALPSFHEADQIAYNVINFAVRLIAVFLRKRYDQLHVKEKSQSKQAGTVAK
jgi:hypothetical protein